ncbi:hypothetical protein F4802DRAFT_607504 [Xylaria palmicola]|nr:hypothetical protein F4802DRAFT_607504 [Xylaria palmicola]
MCVKTYQHFTRCDHVLTTLTTCPTHHKEQESPKGLVGSIFRRSPRKTKDCGRVVPCHLRNESYCQTCSVQRHGLSAKDVGQGALKVRRRDFEDMCHEERKEAARASLQKSEKQRHSGGKLNHDIVGVQGTIWLGELYHRPDVLARHESRARSAAAAPPVSSQPPPGSRQPPGYDAEPGKKTRERHNSEPRHAEGAREWMPAYGSSQPMTRPVQPAPAYQHGSQFANGTRAIPPAIGFPPSAPASLRDSRSSGDSRSSATTRHTELRHKTGQVHNIARSSKQSQDKSQSQSQSQSQNQHQHQSQHRYQQPPSPPQTNYTNRLRQHWVEEPSRWEVKKAAIANWIDKTKDRASTQMHGGGDDDDDAASDASFACETSREISKRWSAQSGRSSISDSGPGRRRHGHRRSK